MTSREKALFREAEKSAKSLGMPVDEFLAMSIEIVEKMAKSGPDFLARMNEISKRINTECHNLDKDMKRGARRSDGNSQIFL